MPPLIRYYAANHVHFITSSTYRRTRVFGSESFRQTFARSLGEVRDRLRFRLIGYVLMPEHFHLLLWPTAGHNPSDIVRSLKVRTAMAILSALRKAGGDGWSGRMLAHLTLPATVHDEAHYRVWQRRFYDMNVWSSKKLDEKLSYMHNNPVKRGLVREPGGWAWSSWRYYYLNDAALLEMDRIP